MLPGRCDLLWGAMHCSLLATLILTFAFLVLLSAQATAEALSGRSSAQRAKR
jgi:hypothetical protein